MSRLLSVSLRLPDALAGPWRITIDPAQGRPDLEPEVPWTQLRPGNRVVFAAGNVYEVERVAALSGEQKPRIATAK